MALLRGRARLGALTLAYPHTPPFLSWGRSCAGAQGRFASAQRQERQRDCMSKSTLLFPLVSRRRSLIASAARHGLVPLPCQLRHHLFRLLLRLDAFLNKWREGPMQPPRCRAAVARRPAGCAHHA